MDGIHGDDAGSRHRARDSTGRTGLGRGAATAAVAAAGAVALAAAAPPAAGQEGGPPCEDGAGEFPFQPPTASPLEPHSRLAAVRIDRGERDRWVALADLGERIPFWISRGCPPEDTASETAPTSARPSGPDASRRPVPATRAVHAPPDEPGDLTGLRLAGSVAAGVFSRFDLEGHGNEFVEAHYRVGLRLRARLRGVEARLEGYHVSSHLGDELLQRTGRSPISTSREGLELLVGARPAPGLRLYGGPGVLVRSTRDLDAASVRGGAEWRGTTSWGPFAPYVSAEAFSWEELGWDPMLAGEAGVAFGDGRFRLAAVAGAGPSRAEQFFRDADETLWGLSFTVTW